MDYFLAVTASDSFQDTALQVAFQHQAPNFVQGTFNSADLQKDLLAVPFLINHSLNRLHMAGNFGQPGADIIVIVTVGQNTHPFSALASYPPGRDKIIRV